jgi:hypothetical protein
VGTTTPGGKLGVDGSVVVGNQAASGTAGTFGITGVGGAVYLQTGQNTTSASAAPLVFTSYGAASEWMRITSAGNVGIGNSNPAYFLEVGSTSTTQQFTQIWRNNGAQNLTAVLAAAGKDSKHIGVDVANNNFYIGRDSSTTDLTINASGNVGIGVASPAARLDISTTTSYGGIKVNANDGGSISFYQPLSNASARNFRIVPNWEAWGSLDFQKSADNASAPTTTVLSIGTTGKLNLLGGSASGGGVGITFPATQSASSDANTLDDYEEGTWTPSVGGNATYNAGHGGRYVKVGNAVTVSFQIAINVIGTGSSATISGLPFATGNYGFVQSVSISYFASLTGNCYSLSMYINNNSTDMNFVSTSSLTNTVNNGPALLGNNSVVYASITYITA